MTEWEVVFRGANYEANVIAAVLESHGLQVEVFDDTAYGTLMESRVFVPGDEAERARDLISQGLKSEPAGN